MEKKILLVFVFVFAWAITVRGQSEWSDSTDVSWYKAGDSVFNISNGAQLAGLAELVNDGTADFAGKTIRLTDDIDLDNLLWTPIGRYDSHTNPTSNRSFQGVFRGNEKVITGLEVSTTSAASYYAAGLFGHISGSARIEDLTLKNADITGTGRDSYTGALVGVAYNYIGTMSIVNCRVLGGTVQGSGTESSITGGIVGYAGGSWELSRCVNTAGVTGMDNSVESMTGGIVAQASSTFGHSLISECSNTGNVTGGVSSGFTATGGIVGRIVNHSGHAFSLTNCFSNCTVTAATNSFTGGIAGLVDNSRSAAVSITHSYAAGTIVGSSASNPVIGGVVGRTGNSENITIQKCLALQSSISGTAGTGKINRIVGVMQNTNINLDRNYAFIPTNRTWSDPVDDGYHGFDTDDTKLKTHDFYFTDSLHMQWDRNLWYLPEDSTMPLLAGFGFGGGTGESGNPYIIRVRKHLEALAEEVNGGTTFAGNYFLLDPENGDELSLSGADWTPIGRNDIDGNSSRNRPFQGVFRGNGKAITGLKVSATSSASYYAAGLFGYIGGSARIEDLTLIDADITGTGSNSYTGALVGVAYNDIGTMAIVNCGVLGGTVQGGGSLNSMTGGIVGYAGGSWELSRCVNTAGVTGENAYLQIYTGGIVGFAANSRDYSLISECSNTGNVTDGTSPGNSFTGGIVGRIFTHSGHAFSLTNCFSNCTVTTVARSYTGGIVGNVDNTTSAAVNITHSYAAGTIDGSVGSDPVLGGVVGRTGDNDNITIQNCLALQSRITDTAGNGTFNRIVGQMANEKSHLDNNYAYIPTGPTKGWETTEEGDNKYGKNWDGLMTSLPVSDWDTTVWIIDPAHLILPKLRASDSDINSPFRAMTIEVAFDTQNSSIIPPVTVAFSKKVPEPTDPTLTGYTFGGWFTEQTCINEWDFDNLVSGLSTDTTLYAKWTLDQYTVILPHIDGVTYDKTNPAQLTVYHGYDFTFRPAVGDDYSPITLVTANYGHEVTANDDGSYTIRNVTHDVRVSIHGVTLLYGVTVSITLDDESLRGDIELFPSEGVYRVPKNQVMRILAYLSDDADESDLRMIANGDTIVAEEKKEGLRDIAYTFRIPIRSETEIRVIGAARNPVGNETVSSDGIRVYTLPGYAVVEVKGEGGKVKGPIRVYSVTGQLVDQRPLAEGTTAIPLKKGIYIVVVDDQTVKIIL